jgi:hypothetical protein
MPYNEDSIKESYRGCQAPELLSSGVSVTEAVAVWLSGLYPRKPILHWVHLLRVNVGKAKTDALATPKANFVFVDKVSAFCQYREALADKLVVVSNRFDGSTARIIRRSDSSRYFPEGRYRIKAKIVKRMGGFYSTNGLMLTATYAPQLITLDEAWRRVGSDGRRLLDDINRWRRRHGLARVRGIKVIEVQPSTGYPHFHIAFPKLRWLAPVAKLTEWWGQAPNSVDLVYRDNFSPTGYVCKYISKLEGWSDESMAEIWFNRTRLYSMSRDYYTQVEDKRIPEWVFYTTKHLSSLSMPELMVAFDNVDCRDRSVLRAGFT